MVSYSSFLDNPVSLCRGITVSPCHGVGVSRCGKRSTTSRHRTLSGVERLEGPAMNDSRSSALDLLLSDLEALKIDVTASYSNADSQGFYDNVLGS